MLHLNEGYGVSQKCELFEAYLYTILTSSYINYLHIWFMQIDLILNFFLWISLNFILKISHISFISKCMELKNTPKIFEVFCKTWSKKLPQMPCEKAFIKYFLN
jgi:hypothetical protein